MSLTAPNIVRVGGAALNSFAAQHRWRCSGLGLAVLTTCVSASPTSGPASDFIVVSDFARPGGRRPSSSPRPGCFAPIAASPAYRSRSGAAIDRPSGRVSRHRHDRRPAARARLRRSQHHRPQPGARATRALVVTGAFHPDRRGRSAASVGDEHSAVIAARRDQGRDTRRSQVFSRCKKLHRRFPQRTAEPRPDRRR